MIRKIKNFILERVSRSKRHKHVQVFDNPKVNSYFEKDAEVKRKSAYKNDDYNWNLYNEHYRGELEEISKEHIIKLEVGDYTIENNILTKKNEEILKLHPNWHVLYETILQLNPVSVVEVGCGSAMHLHNLQVLNHSLELTGYDMSEEQLKFSRELFPEFNGSLALNDITSPLDQNAKGRYNVSYTQAVIMHLRTKNNHIKALKNLFELATDQVVLMENWSKHSFKEVIENLYSKGKISWPDLFFHYKPEPTTNKPHIMICSRMKLEYPELHNYNILSNK